MVHVVMAQRTLISHPTRTPNCARAAKQPCAASLLKKLAFSTFAPVTGLAIPLLFAGTGLVLLTPVAAATQPHRAVPEEALPQPLFQPAPVQPARRVPAPRQNQEQFPPPAFFPQALAPNMPQEPMGFIADSPAASDTLRRIAEHVRASNIDPAATLLRQLLTEQPHALIPTETDADLHITVRARARRLILSNPPLLQRLRDNMLAEAEKLEQAGDWATLERSWFFTPAGQNATVQLAWSHLSAGRIDAARLVLAELFEPATLEAKHHALRKSLTEALAVATAAPSSLPPSQSSLDPQPAVNLDSLVPLPLASFRITPPADAMVNARRGLTRLDAPGEYAGGRDQPRHRVFPIIADQTVFVATTETVSALTLPDLTPKWSIDVLSAIGVTDEARADLTGGYKPRLSNPLLEEISSVTWFGRTVSTDPAGQSSPAGVLVVVMTYQDAKSSSPTQLVVGIDAQTGLVRWATLLEQLDKSLDANVTVRGPVLASGDTAILSVRKYQPDRRLGAALLLGLDAWTGQLRWSAPVTSAGLAASNREPIATEQSAIDSGIVYRSDRLGAISAHAAHDGRPIWVRRVSTPLSDFAQSTRPFAATGPIVTGSMVICQSQTGDQRTICLLDRETGSRMGTFPAAYLESPIYLLRAGPRLVAIGERSVAIADISRLGEFAAFAAAAPSPNPLDRNRPFNDIADRLEVPRRPASGITTVGVSTAKGGWARAAVMGDELVIPESTGLIVINLNSLNVRSIRLDISGNALAIISPTPQSTNFPAPGSGLLLCGDDILSSVLSLNGALASLKAAMIEPQRVLPSSLALARLATRLGKPELLADALHAAAATAGSTDSDLSNTDRRDLVALGIAALLDGTAGQLSPRIIVDLQVLAQSPSQRGVITLGTAKFALISRQPLKGFELAQSVAMNESLAPLVYRDEKLAMRLGDTAAIVMRDAMAMMDRPQRASLEAAAAGQLAALIALPPAPSIEKLAGFARRYPFTASTLRALSLAADAAGSQGLPMRRSRLLQLAVQNALATPDAQSQVRELSANLRATLQARGLVDAITELNSMLAAGSPPLTPAGPIAAVPSPVRLAASGIQAFAGWAVAQPLQGNELPTSLTRRGELLMRHQDGRIALFGHASTANAGTPAAIPDPALPLSERWSVIGNKDQDVLIADDQTVILIDRQDISMVCINSATGAPLWTSRPFASLVPEASINPPGNGEPAGQVQNVQPLPGPRAGVPQPDARVNQLNRRRISLGQQAEGAIETPRANEEILTGYDGTSIALAQRSGLIVVVSAASGAVQLALRLAPREQITDSKLTGGVLALGTLSAGDEPRLTIYKVPPISEANQTARPAAPIRSLSLPTAAGPIQAVRSTAWGEIIAVQSKVVTCFSPESDEPLWRSDDLLLEISDAWVVGGTLLLADSDRRLWTIALDSGTMHTGPAMRGAILDNGPMLFSPALASAQLASGGIALRSTSELKLLAPDGTLIAADAMNLSDGSILPPVRIGNSYFAVSSVPSRARDDSLIISVTALEATTARALWTGSLLLPAAPHRAVAVGSNLAITAGHSTVLYRTEPLR